MGQIASSDDQVNEYGIKGGKPSEDVFMVTEDQERIIDDVLAESANITLRSMLGPWWIQMGENARRCGPNRQSVAEFRLSPERDLDTLVIIGPGASSKLYADGFADIRKVATIATFPTALHWAKSNGAEPDFVVTADSNESQPLLLRSANNTAPVLATVTAHPDLGVEQNCYWYTPLMGNGQPEPQNNEWYYWDIPVMCWNQDVDWNFPSVGCVANMTVQIAQDLRARSIIGARRIVLIGVDFGPWNGYRRVPANHLQKDFPKLDNEVGLVKYGEHFTDPVSLIYKLTMMRMWQQNHIPIYSMSHGILEEFPRVGIGHVLSGDFPEYPSRHEINDRTRRYFAWFADNFPRVNQEHYEHTEANNDIARQNSHNHAVAPDSLRKF